MKMKEMIHRIMILSKPLLAIKQKPMKNNLGEENFTYKMKCE